MKRQLLTVFALIGVAIALYLTLYKVGAIGTLSCSVGSCESVNSSRWATFLGLPVAAWGLGFYVMLFVTALLSIQPRWSDSIGVSQVLVGLTAWGVLFSAWLTYLELFVIHAICIWCITSAALVTVMFVVSLLELRERRVGLEGGD